MSQKFREKILQGSGFSNVQFESDYAMKLMKKMGWSEGKGLGKEEHGIVDCIQMHKRDDNMGLGYEKSEKFRWNNNWWENTYNESIKNINIDYKDSEPEETNDTSEEEETGPNHNRLKRRKNRLNYKKAEKPKKTVKKVKDEDDEELSEDESEDEEKEEKILSNSKKIKKKQI